MASMIAQNPLLRTINNTNSGTCEIQLLGTLKTPVNERNRDLSTTTAHSTRISHIMWQTIAVVLWCAFGLLPAFSQQIQVNRQNKTIAITVDESVSVDPEVAMITVGYQNYAPTKDAAYGDNIRVSNEVTKALLNSGVPKSALETELSLIHI